MEQHDYDILLNAFDDFEDIFTIFQSLDATEEVECHSTIDLVNERLEYLAQNAGLKIAVSDTCYGEMTFIEMRSISKAEIVNDTGKLAGPPFYYVHLPYSAESMEFLNYLHHILSGKAPN